MPNMTQWDAAWNSEGTVLTTQLDGLATSNASALGTTVIANDSSLDQYFAAVLYPGASLTPGAGAPYAALYAVPAIDGTNYADNFVAGSASEILPPGYLCGIFTMPASTAGRHRCACGPFLLGPGKYKFFLHSELGASLAANTNIVTLYSCNDELQ